MYLQSECINELYKNSPIETKMDVISKLCYDIPYEDFFNSNLVITKLKQFLCDNIQELSKHPRFSQREIIYKDNTKYLKYLFTHDNFITFNDLTELINNVLDMMRWVIPSEWRFFFMKNDKMHIFIDDSLNDGLKLKPFDFQRDIIDAKFPPSKIFIGDEEREWYSF